MTTYHNPTPTTDAILEYKVGNKFGLVLIERGRVPFGLAMPGGYHEEGLSGEENAIKEVFEETGLYAFTDVVNRPFRSMTSPGRDPRQHNVSNVYIMRGFGQLRAGDDAKGAAHYTLDQVRSMIDKQQFAFDHGNVLSEYLDHPEQRTTKQKWTLGIIGRFKPLHNGNASALEAMCEQADEVVIGIGSSSTHNIHNPFTSLETMEMIDAHLAPRFKGIYRFFEISDYYDDIKWTAAAQSALVGVDIVVSGNGLVQKLLSNAGYQQLTPEQLIGASAVSDISATKVRVAMAQGDSWRMMVPEAVADYLLAHGLMERFRQEFSQEILNNHAGEPTDRSEAAERSRLYNARDAAPQ